VGRPLTPLGPHSWPVRRETLPGAGAQKVVQRLTVEAAPLYRVRLASRR